jgi:hypothetical protein
MRMKPIVSLTTAAMIAFAWGAPARAEEAGSQSFRISVTVPEYCEIHASPINVGEGNGFAFGSVFESCNVQEGFQVAASYRSLEPGESVALSYAGQSRVLHADGWSQVANRVGAKYGVRPISIRHAGLTAPLAINLTITYF